MHRTIRALAAAGLLLVGVAAAPVSAAEAAPPNDNIATPTVIGGMPFSDSISWCQLSLVPSPSSS